MVMFTEQPEVATSAPQSAPLVRAPVAARILAGIGGVLWLVAISIGLLGVPLLVGLTLLASAILVGRRGRILPRGQAWLIAFFSAGVIIALGFGALILSLPAAERDRITAAGSDPAAEPNLPDWLERLNQRSAQGGGAAGDAAAARLAESKPFQLYITIFTAVVLVAFLGAFVGSLTWLGAGLLRLAIRGTWFPPGERKPLPGDPLHAPLVDGTG